MDVIPYTAYHIERLRRRNGNRRKWKSTLNPSEIKYRFDPDGISGADSGYFTMYLIQEIKQILLYLIIMKWLILDY